MVSHLITSAAGSFSNSIRTADRRPATWSATMEQPMQATRLSDASFQRTPFSDSAVSVFIFLSPSFNLFKGERTLKGSISCSLLMAWPVRQNRCSFAVYFPMRWNVAVSWQRTPPRPRTEMAAAPSSLIVFPSFDNTSRQVRRDESILMVLPLDFGEMMYRPGANPWIKPTSVPELAITIIAFIWGVFPAQCSNPLLCSKISTPAHRPSKRGSRDPASAALASRGAAVAISNDATIHFHIGLVANNRTSENATALLCFAALPQPARYSYGLSPCDRRFPE